MDLWRREVLKPHLCSSRWLLGGESIMGTDTSLGELLRSWEDMHERGNDVEVEVLCREKPDLIEHVAR